LFIEPSAGMALSAISLGIMASRGEQGRNRYGDAPEVAHAEFGPVDLSSEDDLQTSYGQPIRDKQGVLRLEAGSFECAGSAFASYREAYQYSLSENRRSIQKVDKEQGSADSEGPLEQATAQRTSEVRLPSMSPGTDKYEVTPTSDGRFMSGGYTFT
ncbi:hypothetical protein OY671_010883, partial [Metschnikowia pulcherrima]